ncbi:hypothetical protein [Streptomyces sp. NPDC056291]|uniref:hypothetical protein n=1 Tax=unclassified Streptomyces TaxID=2593676 RepID=UPI0035DF3CFC
MALSIARKAVIAAVAAAAIGGVSLGASAVAAPPAPASGPAVQRSGASATVVAKRDAASQKQAPRVVTQVIGKGRVDGQRWSVALEFYPTLPEGFTLPTQPDGTTVPGTSLLCQRMYIGGVRIDHQGGRWSDCQPVNGAHDPQGTGSMGLWGLQDKGTSGTRLMVANPEADVAYGVLAFSDGSSVKAATVGVPGTDYRAWAAPIANGKTIAAVDQYDAHHHRLSHDTYWR